MPWLYERTGTDETDTAKAGTDKLGIANYIEIFGRILSARVYLKRLPVKSLANQKMKIIRMIF